MDRKEKLINLYINLQVAEKKQMLFEQHDCPTPALLKLRIENLKTEIKELESTCS